MNSDVVFSGSNSDMVLVLDPLVREKVSCPLTLRTQRDSGSPSSDVIPSYRDRSNSGESTRSQDSSQRKRLDSGASERSRGCSRPGSEPDASEPGPPSAWTVGAERGAGGYSLSTESGAEINNHEVSKADARGSATTADVETVDGAVNSKKTGNPASCSQQESRGRPKASSFRQKVRHNGE